MLRRPPGSKLPYPLVPYTTLFRSPEFAARMIERQPIGPGPRRPANPHRNGDAVDDKDSVRALCRQGDFPNRPRPPPQRSSRARTPARSEEHTSELQSLMRISYAVFCLKKKNIKYRT